jgi:hypothetical protein
MSLKDTMTDDEFEKLLEVVQQIAQQALQHAVVLESLQIRLAKAERTLQNLCESMTGDGK